MGLVPYTDAPLDLLSPASSREEVLERIDASELQSAPLNLLISTAMALAAPGTEAYVEDAVLRQTTALTSQDGALYAHTKLMAETLVLANTEYQTALQAYQDAEAAVPRQDQWTNPRHYLQALSVHERRMDRALRLRKEAFERLDRASGLYREALLTRDGLEILKSIRVRSNTQETEVRATVVKPLEPR